MNHSALLLQHLPRLRLRRLGDETEAGLWIVSLPWPRSAVRRLRLNGRPTHCLPIGQWPAETAPRPRRLLLIADGANRAPETIRLKATGRQPSRAVQSRSVRLELFERSPHPEYVWERHLIRFQYGARTIGLAMGLRTRGEVHWWEACRLVVLRETADCIEFEAGGATPHHIMSLEEFKSHPGYTNPWLHRHHWLNGHVYGRFHANGVCEIYAHHINSRFVDDGLPLADCVPVLGLQADVPSEQQQALCGPWDGSRQEITVGAVRFDFTEVARLGRPQEPGQISAEGRFLVLQPYQGVDVFGGICPEQLFRDPVLFHAEQREFPRGMARTLRFSFSLSDRSPRLVRYLAPAWWYGACEEFLPEPLLPVSNEFDPTLDASCRWVRDHIVRGGFEDGSVPRHLGFGREVKGRIRHEPGWEGEMPYAQFLSAWRSANVEDYNAAMRSAYHFTDIAIDHAAKLVRMHGYPPQKFAVPMNRLQGPIAAYLETADPYLLDAAQAVTANAYWTHRNSWPRLAVGRDACFVRSAVLLYRYFAVDFYRTIAREGVLAVVRSQRPNGSFGDQGGGTGIHQWGAYITKPWMGLLALNGVLDYLELFPREDELLQAVRKFADWLMTERFDHDGVLTWSYQHDYDGRRQHLDPYQGAQVIPLPTPHRWHQETLARLLGYAAFTWGNPRYLDAWAESHAGIPSPHSDHEVAAALQFLPWLQAKLWNARLTTRGIEIRPVHFGPRTPTEGRILTPRGPVTVRWRDARKLSLPRGVSVRRR